MKTEVTPVVVSALGTVKKRMAENIKKSIRESYCDRDSKDLLAGICTNPQEGAWSRCMVYNNNITTMIYLTTISSKSTSARSKYERALHLQL